jgi:hypothetical protein
VKRLRQDLPRLVDKGYHNLALNCYWHHFNPSGDGRVEVSTEPLQELVQAIREVGMYASLSVETYGVGGGQIPAGFWERCPQAIAINHQGKPVSDTEYGYFTQVPSLFSTEYLQASRGFMTDLVRTLGAEHFLYFETTVEPQYMGSQWLDYSPAARRAWCAWLEQHPEQEAPDFPTGFPVPESFRLHATWNRFRAQHLAEWINGDAQALKAGADGRELWIATDYLDAERDTEIKRCGNPLELLRYMTGTDILQVNWSWCNLERKPNSKAYDRVDEIRHATSRDWAVAEHMTINGCDYEAGEIRDLLRHTLERGTCFGWEFVDIAADTDSEDTVPNQILPGDFKPQHFGVYDADWHPKPPMQVVEEHWDEWMRMMAEKSGFLAGKSA